MRNRIGACLLAAGALLGWASDAGAAPERFAIVIGVNRADTVDAPTLRYADDDAVATHTLLVESGVDSALLTELDQDSAALHPNAVPDGPPSWRALTGILAGFSERMRAAQQRGQQTELLLFYSGHGDVASGEGYLALADRRLTRTDLRDLLRKSPATTNHVLVDACKSYFIAFERGPGGRRSRYAGGSFAGGEGELPANTGFVLSTSSDRDSHEWERYQAGVFSHEVRSALRGAADADRDGRITYAELGAFLTTANRGIANPRYRPDFAVYPPRAMSEPLLSWPRSPNVLELDTEVGHVYVEDAGGTRVLDAHARPGQQLALRLPMERPLFLRTADEGAEWRIGAREPGLVSRLVAARPTIARRGALHLALAKLFAQPFGALDVQRYRGSVELAARPAFALETEVGRAPRSGWRAATGWGAAGGLALGITFNIVALQTRRGAADSSQRDRVQANRRIDRLNLAAGASYAVAGAAAVLWLLSKRENQPLLVVPVAGPGTAGAAIEFSF